MRSFFKTYYAPNNAVLVVVGDTTAAEVRRLAERHLGSIPRQSLPPPADVSEPPQTASKHFTRQDKLARTPALAAAWHLPPRMSRDFFALSVLDPLLNSDDSARMYRKLVREERLAVSSSGGFNFLGSNWDMKGPMLYTMRGDYLDGKTAEQVLAAIEPVRDEIEEVPVSRHDGVASSGSRGAEDDIVVGATHRMLEGDRIDHLEARAKQPDGLVGLGRTDLDLLDQIPAHLLEDRLGRDRLGLTNAVLQQLGTYPSRDERHDEGVRPPGAERRRLDGRSRAGHRV